MPLIDRVLKTIKDRRQKVLDGKINCIPSPIRQFRYDFPGVEQGCYYLVSGAAKSSKSKITNFLFLYSTVLYAWKHPEKARLKVFYCLLEETQENITMKFMCYLLYILSGHKIRVDIKTLKSVDAGRSVDPLIIETLQTMEYQSILRFYEEHVTFIPERHPTGIFSTINDYAKSHGVIHKKPVPGKDYEIFDWYEPDDEDEYVLCIVDHVGLISNERTYDLRQSIDKLSEYMKVVRNKYNYTPVIVQQQNSETLSLEAYKNRKIRPTQKGLRDSQTPALDCDVMLGITNPFSFELPKYPDSNTGYDITKLRGYARFLECVLGRDGESNALIGLYFDGATGYYTALPSPSNLTEMQKVYSLVAANSQAK